MGIINPLIMEICSGEKEQHEPPSRRPLCEADVMARPDVTARLADSGPRPVERMMTSRSAQGTLRPEPFKSRKGNEWTLQLIIPSAPLPEPLAAMFSLSLLLAAAMFSLS